jgi:tartrate dehydratase alpha subunit/fumarate hydratase class I-like protein
MGPRGEGTEDQSRVKVDLQQVEEAAKELYIRALKLLPPDVKQGFERIAASETDAGAQRVIGTMIRNITVAEDNANLLCQDTGIPIYNVRIGRGVGGRRRPEEAIRRGCALHARIFVPFLHRASGDARQRADLDRARRADRAFTSSEKMSSISK